MAPRRKRTTPLGELLRNARHALGADQHDFGAMVYVSGRTVSRWENGLLSPAAAQGKRILDACVTCDAVSDELHDALAQALGFELEDDAPKSTAPAAAPPARPSAEQLRAELEGIVLAASEERDVLPRHLRAFALALLLGMERLGIGAKEAAQLLAVPAKEKKSAARAAASRG